MIQSAKETSPVYVFVGGVSHSPVFFEALIKHLTELGIKSTAVAFPTCGANNENALLWDEVVHIRKVVTDILDGGSNVVLVCHSYGGMPGSRAIRGLDLEARQAEGKATGIQEVVFLAAFLIPDNAPMAAFLLAPPWLSIENGCRRPNEQALPLLFSDMEPAERLGWLDKFEWQRNDYSLETFPDAPWHLSIPKTCIITTCDQTATLEFQFMMLQKVMVDRPDTWRFKSIAAGHEPFISQPEMFAQILLQPVL